MAKEFRAEQVINGTFGEMWIDGEYLANVTALKAEVTLKKTAISMVQRLMEGQKRVARAYMRQEIRDKEDRNKEIQKALGGD